MKLNIKPLSAMIALSVAAGVAVADDCDHERMIEFDVDLSSAESLAIEVGAGALDITGADIDEAQVSAKACASSEELLEQIKVVSEGGSQPLIRTEFPETGGWSLFGGSEYARANVTIRVPESMALDVADSSGAARIENVGDLNMTDSSGGLTIRSVEGDLNVTDSSGGIEVNGVTGTVHITDSSGSIEVFGVDGDAIVDNDSSGGILLKDIGGDAIVSNDSSGGIRFENIGQSARVGNDSSGGISATNVAGDFTVENDGSGGIDYEDVRGEVNIPSNKR